MCCHGNKNMVQWHLNQVFISLAYVLIPGHNGETERANSLHKASYYLIVYQHSILSLAVICQQHKTHQESGIHSLLSSPLFHFRFEPHLSLKFRMLPWGSSF